MVHDLLERGLELAWRHLSAQLLTQPGIMRRRVDLTGRAVVMFVRRPIEVSRGPLAGAPRGHPSLGFGRLLRLWRPGPLRSPARQMVVAAGAILATFNHRLRLCCRFATTIAAPQRGGETVIVSGKWCANLGAIGILLRSRPPVHRVDFIRESVDFLPFTDILVNGSFFGFFVVITTR